jgi:hypothetical protein
VAQEYREFAVTIPAGTALATPVTTKIIFPARVVLSIAWRVPPGPSGKMGWALTSDGAPVIPVQPGTYIVTDNQADTWLLDGYLDSGNWAVTGYNTGVYPHTVYLTFALDLPGTVAPPTPPPTGEGIGVIGTTGNVTTPPGTTPPSGSSPPPPSDDSAAVVTAVLAALLEQIAASAV